MSVLFSSSSSHSCVRKVLVVQKDSQNVCCFIFISMLFGHFSFTLYILQLEICGIALIIEGVETHTVGICNKISPFIFDQLHRILVVKTKDQRMGD